MLLRNVIEGVDQPPDAFVDRQPSDHADLYLRLLGFRGRIVPLGDAAGTSRQVLLQSLLAEG
jgi:hypothetical protein